MEIQNQELVDTPEVYIYSKGNHYEYFSEVIMRPALVQSPMCCLEDCESFSNVKEQ